MAHNGIEGLCSIVRPLGQQEASHLSARVMARIVREDGRGRPFGSPRNPRMPTVEEFRPTVGEVRTGDIASAIRGRRHGINPEQAASVRQMTNEELLRFRIEDPISGHIVGDGFEITGGHHRLAEITRRIEAGELPPDILVRILVHD